MKAKLVKDNLVIRVKLSEPTPSSTGKTLLVATAGKDGKTDLMMGGKPVNISLNAYITPKDRPFVKTDDKSVKQEKDELVITLPVVDLYPSQNGKSLNFASTKGNTISNVKVNDRNVVVSCTAYISAK